VGIGFAMSVVFLLRNLYPVLSATDRQTSKVLLVLVVALHLGLAIAIKVLFFAAGSPAPIKDTPPPANEGDGAAALMHMLMS
jgi:protein YIPF1/2